MYKIEQKHRALAAVQNILVSSACEEISSSSPGPGILAIGYVISERIHGNPDAVIGTVGQAPASGPRPWAH